MPVVKCKGVAALINNNSKCEFDDQGRFLSIPKPLAKKYASKSRNLPLRLEHNKNFSVGTVHEFYEAKLPIKGVEKDVLAVDFTINDESFICAVRNACQCRMQEINKLDFKSSDGFLKETNPQAPIDITARDALQQRLPELSLCHDAAKEDLDIIEMSLCVAGKRPYTVMTDVVYDEKTHGVQPTVANVTSYITFIAALHSMSNGPRCEKVKKDISDLNIPSQCLVYSQNTTSPHPVTPKQNRFLDSAVEKMEPVPQHGLPPNINETIRQTVQNFVNGYMSGFPYNTFGQRGSPRRAIRRYDSDDDEDDYPQEDYRRGGHRKRKRQRSESDTGMDVKKEIEFLKSKLAKLEPKEPAEDQVVRHKDICYLIDKHIQERFPEQRKEPSQTSEETAKQEDPTPPKKLAYSYQPSTGTVKQQLSTKLSDPDFIYGHPK